jgi:hypothetical protein
LGLTGMTAELIALLTPPALVLVAHILRALRWTLLFPAGALDRRFDLLLALGVGYAANLVLPVHVGDVVRSLVVSRRTESLRFAYVLATVAVERLTDLAAVSAIFIVMAATSGQRGVGPWIAPAGMAAAALAGAIVAAAVRRSPAVRQGIWRAASLFNDGVRTGVADFFWSFGEIAAGPTVLRWRFALASLAMWAMYLTAYESLAGFIGAPIGTVVQAMLGAPLQALAPHIGHGAFAEIWAPLVNFVTLPILVIVGYGAVREGLNRHRAFSRLKQYGMSGVDAPATIRERFKAMATYEQYLTDLFDGGAAGKRGFERKAIGDSIVHKFFNGGSDAVTALVEVGGELRIRKFALGAAADKLAAQAFWLADPARSHTPVAAVIERDSDAGMFRFDMPMVTPSNDFYDVIHTSPIANSKALLARVIGCVDDFHRASALANEASTTEIEIYLEVKGRRNAILIEDFARRLLPWNNFSVNGTLFDPALWARLRDLVWLSAQIRDRRVAAIHGDLTIENIIIAPNHPGGFYLIDPNPENIFNSPLIDWAKLMQSLHLGYESLNHGAACRRSDSGLVLATMRSHDYAELHAMLEREIVSRFGEDGLREVYFHEIVNYLRLTPYKIRQNQTRGLAFFACTAILLGRYFERWG